MDFFQEKTDGNILGMLHIFKFSVSKMSCLWGLAFFPLGVFNLPTAETYPNIASPFFLHLFVTVELLLKERVNSKCKNQQVFSTS